MFTITITITYDYIPLHYMIRKGGPPWVRHLSAPYWSLLGVSLVSLAATMQPHAPVPNVASSPWPIPLGEVGLRWFCENQGWGGGKRSVCSGNFTHVTHIVKLFRWIKYYRLRTLHIWNIANKTSFRSCTLFHISDLLQIDPTSFGGGGREQGRFAKIQIFAVLELIRKGGISCKFA